MSFIVVPPNSGYPTNALSLPNMASFAVSDDGGGGSVLINGLGVLSGSVANAIDLKTYFGVAFHSTPLLRAFRACVDVATAMMQFLNNMEIGWWALGGTGLAATPAFIPVHGVGGGPTDAPYMEIAGPSVAGFWRVEFKLRSTLTD